MSKSTSPQFDQLLRLVQRLRGEGGCPWDQKQTPASLRKYFVEEAEELAEAIDEQDPDHICEELGDMLFILSTYIVMFEEQSAFTRTDVLQEIIEKMTRRHPHVFGDVKEQAPEALRKQWEEIKAQEKQSKANASK